MAERFTTTCRRCGYKTLPATLDEFVVLLFEHDRDVHGIDHGDPVTFLAQVRAEAREDDGLV